MLPPPNNGLRAVQSTANRALSTGAIVGVAFRLFTYGLLAGIYGLLDHSKIYSLWQGILYGIYWALAFFSPFWVPFVGGFLSAHFWRHSSNTDYARGINITAALLLAFSALLLLSLGAGIGIALLVVFAYIDAGMCRSGFERGRKFWLGLLGHQFLGDFSTTAEEVAPTDYF